MRPGGLIVDPVERKRKVTETLYRIYPDAFFHSVQQKFDLKYRPSRWVQEDFLSGLVDDILDMTTKDAVAYVEQEVETWMRDKSMEIMNADKLTDKPTA